MVPYANPILNTLQSLANIGSENFVNFTKFLNEIPGKPGVDQFMDQVVGVGHRIKFGHSLDYLPKIYNEFGLTGIPPAVSHWFRDLCSPHGVPIPWAKEIGETIGISMGDAVKWLCFNIGDFVSGSLSLFHSMHTYKALNIAVATGYLSPAIAASIAAGAAVKVSSSIYSGNLVSLGCGIFDLGILGWALLPALTMGKSYFVVKSMGVAHSMLGASIGGLSSLISYELAAKLLKVPHTSKTAWRNRSIACALGALSGAATATWTRSTGVIIAASAAAGAALASGTALLQSEPRPRGENWIDLVPEFLLPAN